MLTWRTSLRLSKGFRRNLPSVNEPCYPARVQEPFSGFMMEQKNNYSGQKVLTLDSMNPHVKVMEYAVRGPLVIRATEIEKELEAGSKKPFQEVIKANIGDAHAMGQQPITFIRQVLSLVSYPQLIDQCDFPSDVKKKARDILGGCKGSSAGSYSDSVGLELIRKHVAEYIESRDGIPSNPDNIILCAGASEGIRATLKLFKNEDTGVNKPGVLIPIPQYPLYSATLAEYDLAQVGYYLDEDNNWGLEPEELERALAESKKTCQVKAIVVINPGNPTGQVLTRKNVEGIIKFAQKNNLFILADEVYQHNVYAPGSAFYSFKKVLSELGPPCSNVELASYFSVSKGYMGECGLRGGYTELLNVDPAVKTMLLKSISAKLCPTVLGQATMDCVVDPPKPGDPSFELFSKERQAVLDSLAVRAKQIEVTFNSLPGFKCNTVQGAMYAFPQITLPSKAIAAAKAQGQKPDVFYAFELLENTGICIVPGSGFGQRPDTYHFRTTILPQPEKLTHMLKIFGDFHQNFMKKYA